MINNKMLKEPLFLEFNSSGVLNRAEQTVTKFSGRDDLENYRLLGKEECVDSLSSDKYNNERESMNISKTGDTSDASDTINQEDNINQFSSNTSHDIFFCFPNYDILSTIVPDCIIELRLGFCFNE